MAVRAEITSEPGMVDLLEQEGDVADEKKLEALNHFRATKVVSRASLREPADVGTLSVERAYREHAYGEDAYGEDAYGEGAYSQWAFRDDWWDGLGRWLRGEKVKKVGRTEAPVEMGVYWLTVPEVPDAKATLDVALKSDKETSASLTIFGVGGGPTFTVALKEGLSHEAARSERVALSAMGTFEKIEVSADAGTVTYPRLVALDQANLTWVFASAMPPKPEACGPRISSTTFDASGASGTTTKTLSIGRDTKWKLGIDLDLANLGLKASLDGSITYSREVGFEYTLPGGRKYVAAQYKDFPAYLWSES
jgi:hypothetical protein